MSETEWWSLKGWRFELQWVGGSVYFSVPDRGGMADMMPREPAQLRWAEGALDGLPGLRRVWNTTWEVDEPRGLDALRALWVAKGGAFHPGYWSEAWTLGAWQATLQRRRAGTLFVVHCAPGAGEDDPEAAAQAAWCAQHLGGWAGVERVGPLLWRISTSDGLEALRMVWEAAGGSMGPDIHTWE